MTKHIKQEIVFSWYLRTDAHLSVLVFEYVSTRLF